MELTRGDYRSSFSKGAWSCKLFSIEFSSLTREEISPNGARECALILSFSPGSI